MENKRYLTWDDLGDLYELHTNKSARILPLDRVFDWALKNQNKLGIKYEEKTGMLYFAKEDKNEEPH